MRVTYTVPTKRKKKSSSSSSDSSSSSTKTSSSSSVDKMAEFTFEDLEDTEYLDTLTEYK